MNQKQLFRTWIRLHIKIVRPLDLRRYTIEARRKDVERKAWLYACHLINEVNEGQRGYPKITMRGSLPYYTKWDAINPGYWRGGIGSV